MENKGKIKKALIDDAIVVGTSSLGILGAHAAENHLDGYMGPGVAFGAGTLTLAFAPDWAKPAGGILVGYSLLSAIKKVVFKPNVRRTGLLAEVETLLPGYALPAPSIQETTVVDTTQAKENTLLDKVKSGVQKVKLSLGMGEADADFKSALAGATISGLEEALSGETTSLKQALSGTVYNLSEKL